MKVPKFEYAPMKITFKRKLELSSLTPKENRPIDPGKFLLKTLIVCMGFAMAAVTVLILMGALKLFGVKEL